MTDVIDAASTDAEVLAEAGFPALLIENFGDVPFHADSVPPETVAGITAAAAAVSGAVGLPFGINVLRNDALAALGIAAAAGASFIRVNVLSGLMYTDQGPIVGRASDVIRKRREIARDLQVWADVMVKHATPPAGTSHDRAAMDTVERGMADAVIVSGAGTGTEPDLEHAVAVRAAVPSGTRIVMGSGATVDNLEAFSEVVDSVIVGSSLKREGHASNPVDPDRAAHFVKIAQDLGLT